MPPAFVLILRYLNPVLREEFVKFVAELKESLAGKKAVCGRFPLCGLGGTQ